MSSNPKESETPKPQSDSSKDSATKASTDSTSSSASTTTPTAAKETESSTTNPLPNLYDRFVSSFEKALSQAEKEGEKKPEGGLNSFTLEGIAEYIQKYQPKNVIFLVGAGISTSAGIPDFRTPGTGLYDNIQKYNLSCPEEIFSIQLFRRDPVPFFDLAKNLFMSDVKPTPAHYFMRLMAEKGHVRRIYTQNIDILEYLSGTPADKIVTAHGSHYTSTCQKCKQTYNQEWFANHLRFSKELVAHCDKCKSGVVKPDIVFFGENLPKRFHQHVKKDFEVCDLLIIMGTSLVVYPVAGLIDDVKPHIPRLLINLEPVGKGVLRDVFYEGSADDGVKKLTDLLGWKPELDQMIEHEWKKLDKEFDEIKKKIGTKKD
uniref:Deacetylase sirtuin-type domain-containing protein n=1 Tax=Panagrolaimus sp. ES5 TaxID=591445 RepID=A0AC34F9Q5_9BILA